MFSEALLSCARKLIEKAQEKNLRLVVAESCTGGLMSALFTEIPGASSVYERGFVTYSDEAKEELLGVPHELIAQKGVVSEEVAHAMALGALAHSTADLALAVTGIAGPGGGSPQKPIGLVHIAAACKNGEVLQQKLQLGDIGRSDIRLKSVMEALALLDHLL